MTVLALDLGAHLGWVKGGTVGPLAYGTFDLPETTNLSKWLAASDGFYRSILPGVTAVVVEQPFLGKSYWPARKLISMLGHLHYWAGFHGLGARVTEIPVASGKINLSGNGGADAEQMIAAALTRYGMTLNEHEAHALGIWDVFHFGAAETKAQRERRARDERKGRIIQP